MNDARLELCSHRTGKTHIDEIGVRVFVNNRGGGQRIMTAVCLTAEFRTG